MLSKTGYWLTRIVFLRCLAAVYHVAFLIALFQNRPLIGQDGLLPANLYLQQTEAHLLRSGQNTTVHKLTTVPTLLWFVDYQNHLDAWLDVLAYSGLALSTFVFINGGANIFVMTTLWLLYHSIVNVGQTWYSFGWESQLLETGFLAIWFCPVVSVAALPERTPPSPVVIWGYRWLIFRIMIGAGLIKWRGDLCWRLLTCMDYHYQTQPVPNPISYWMHQSPWFIHRAETAANHVVELAAPILLLTPIRWARLVGGALQIAFMGMIVVSGNLSFLNHLTMLPSLCCFDDRLLSVVFSRRTIDKVAALEERRRVADVNRDRRSVGEYIRRVYDVLLFALLAYLSVPVVRNLFFARQQQMNTSFEPLRLVNTYGAFGSITKQRTEVIVQGTSSEHPYAASAVWLDYEFHCKPGAVDRRPCLISPYHYRLDWLMWFAAFQNYQHNPWLVHLAAKLLRNDRTASQLLQHNPFLEGESPPKFIRMEHYRYIYAPYGGSEAKKGRWWIRKRIGTYMQPVDLKMLTPVMAQFGWK